METNNIARLAVGACAILVCCSIKAESPTVSNVTAQQRADTQLVEISYDLESERTPLTISVDISTNAGATYDLPATSFSGDIGAGIIPGTGKSIVWNAGTDWLHHFSQQMRVRVTADDGWRPPDPESEAPPPANGVATLFSSSIAFIYSGTNPVQIGVAEGTIDPARVIVLRGRVTDTNGLPITQVKIEIQGHPEYGMTMTRTNGLFDMAVNGGNSISLNFSKTDYLSVQRTIDIAWHNSMVLDDVVMKNADTKLSRVNFGGSGLRSSTGQAASGSTIEDESGQRTARVFFPSGTSAYVIKADGTTQQVSTLTTRFTEFTVGDEGPAAMPGNLPDTVAYTYALELGALEAELKVDGKDVLFNQAVYFYVDNFLNMPVGTIVPAGYYDDEAEAWIPSPNGLVIGLLGTDSQGLAQIDITGLGEPADDAALTALGFSSNERLFLAEQYNPTQTLWRTPITHFSRWDLNYPSAPEPGAEGPNTPPPTVDEGGEVNPGSNQDGAGEIELENQVFRESIPIVGTPFSLNYSSRNASGYSAGARTEIILTGSTYPESLKIIELSICIAGQTHRYQYAPAANLTHVFTWDGKDSYQRDVRGARKAKIKIFYIYDSYYTVPIPDVAMAVFGLPAPTALGVKTRWPVRMSQVHEVYLICSSPVFSLGFGGWTLSPHHIYDPYKRILLTGDGKLVDKDLFRTERRIYGERQEYGVISTLAGTGTAGYSGDEGQAKEAQINNPTGLRIAPDGALYFADNSNNCIRKVSVNGIISTVAGTGTPGFSGDGGLATAAQLDEPSGVFITQAGEIYIADTGNNRVRRVDRNGIITTVAGGGSNQPGDDQPATNAFLPTVRDVILARDGTMFIAAAGHARVHRVGPDGIINTYAGTGESGYSGDGGSAREARIDFPYSLALSEDGALYIGGAPVHPAVRRVGTDGIITTVAGTGTAGYSGNRGTATNARFHSPMGIALATDGTLFIADDQNRCLRVVGSEGIVNLAVGRGNPFIPDLGDGYPARNSRLEKPKAVAVSPDGEIYIADTEHNRIRRVSPLMANVAYLLRTEQEHFIASDDGRFLYKIDQNSRHTATFNALTCEKTHDFAYTANGLLASITDGYGNITTIERDDDGNPTAIIAPDGQRTTLTLNADDCLASITNPNNETMTFSYSTNGLLTGISSQRGAAYDVEYNAFGRAIELTKPLGNITTYARASASNEFTVTVTSSMEREHNYNVRDLADGTRVRATVFPDNSVRIITNTPDGVESRLNQDGTRDHITYGADPRLGFQSPFKLVESNRWPSGRSSVKTQSRSAALSDDNPLNLLAVTNITVQNNKTNTSVFTVADRRTVTTTRAGRQFITTVDAQNQPLTISAPGLAPITNRYDARGRLIHRQSSADGVTRTESYSYNTNGYMRAITNGLDESTLFSYDGAGRVATATRAGQTIGFSYDVHGNRTNIITAAGHTHGFTYNLADLPTSYIPPDAGEQTGVVTFDYNEEYLLTQVNLADGRTVSNTFNSAGQLTARAVARGNYTASFHPGGLPAQLTSPDGVIASNLFDGDILTSIHWTGTVTGIINLAYNNDLLVSAINVNGQIPGAFLYDADGLITNACDLSVTRNSSNGFVTATTLGDVTDTYTYNGFGELTNYTAAISGEVFYAYALQYDVLGRVTNKTEIFALYSGATNTYTFAYDALGRLTALNTNDSMASTYQYDHNGNRTNAIIRGSAQTAEYDERDRLTAWGGDTGGTNYFNANGQLTNRIVAGQSTEFVYDELGNLLHVSLPGTPGTNITYLVDGLQRRVGKLVDGVFTKGFLYQDDRRVSAELGSATNVVSLFIYGVRNNTPEYMLRGGNTYRIISDQRGSPRRVINIADGTIEQELDYNEFGQVTRDTNPGFQPFGFAGGIYDHDTALVRFGVRDYDAITGRWTARDPVFFASDQLNLYVYAGNDPINRTDVSGAGPGWPQWINPENIGTALDFAGFIATAAEHTSGTPLGIIGIGFTGWNTGTALEQGNHWDAAKGFVQIGSAIAGATGTPHGIAISLAVTATDYGSQAIFNNAWNTWAHWSSRPASALSESAYHRLQNNSLPSHNSSGGGFVHVNCQ